MDKTCSFVLKGTDVKLGDDTRVYIQLVATNRTAIQTKSTKSSQHIGQAKQCRREQ